MVLKRTTPDKLEKFIWLNILLRAGSVKNYCEAILKD